jgi:hypothetical protein
MEPCLWDREMWDPSSSWWAKTWNKKSPSVQSRLRRRSNTFSNFSPLSNEGFDLFGRCTCGLGVSEELAAEGSFLFCVGVINELVKLSEEVNWPKEANRDDNGGGTERGVETAVTEELLELLGEENKAWPEGGGCINISSSVFSTVSRDMPETNVDDFHSAS